MHIVENSDNLVAHHKQDVFLIICTGWLLNASVSGLML